MSCIVCLENNTNIINTNCGCKFNCHSECFKDFLKNTNISCPFCRIRKNKITNNSDTSQLIDIIFKLPGILALPLWFFFSILFVIFILPFLAIKHFYGKTILSVMYVSVIYLIQSHLILFPMITIQSIVLLLHFMNIRVLYE